MLSDLTPHVGLFQAFLFLVTITILKGDKYLYDKYLFLCQGFRFGPSKGGTNNQ